MAGRRYSAGRIFLDVIPSFKGVIRETEREVQKLRKKVADDNAKAAEQDEKRQASTRKKVRTQAEREAGEAAAAEHDKAWHDMTIAEKREWAHRERLRREALRRSVKDQKEAMVHADAELAKLNARRIAEQAKLEGKRRLDEERKEREHHKLMERLVDASAARQGQAMWKAAQEAAKAKAKQLDEEAKAQAKAQRDVERLISAHRANRMKEVWKQIQDEAKARKAAQEKMDRLHAQAIAEDARRTKRAAAARLKELEREQKEAEKASKRYARLQGGRFGQDLREGITHALKDLGPDIKIDADTSEVDRKVQAVRERLQVLQGKRIGIDISGKEAMRELLAIERQVNRLDRKDIDIAVRTNAKGVSAILREQITVMRAAGRAAGDLGNRHRQSGRDSRDAANAFRIFSWRILGITLAIPAAVPLIAALAGAIGSLIPMALGAASGLGVLILGFTGIAPAVKALGDVQDDAARDSLAAAKTMRNASRAVRDAQQGLDKALEDGARAAEDSARRVADARENIVEATARGAERVAGALERQQRAERSLREAQEASLDAQRDLIQARKDANDQIRDMALRQAGGALAERQARLDLARAKAAYLSIRGSGAHTRDEKEQALLDFQRAELDLESTIRDNARLAEERAHSDAVGVEGSDLVVRAKERVADAQQQEIDAEKDVRDAAVDVADARVEAAKMVADAQRDLSDALRDQARQEVDTERSIRDARERLADSQEAYNEALQQTGEIGSASMRALNEAMESLGPEGRAFALFLHSLREPLAQLRRDVQAGLLPGVQEFMEDMIRVYGPAFSVWATGMGVLLGNIFRQTSAVMQNPIMTAFFDSMERYAGTFTQQVSDVMLNLVQVVAGLSTAFAPFGVQLGDALVRITGGWAAWAASLAESEGFYKFMEYVQRIGPEVTAFFVALGDALITIGIGLAPYGEMLINWATAFFSWIAEADPRVVGAIAAAIIGIVVAIQLAAGAMTLLSGASLFFSRDAAGGFASPLALIILAIVTLVGVVAILRANFEGFREVTDRVAEGLKDLGTWLWENREMVLKVVGVVAALFTAWKIVTGVMPYVMNAFKVARGAMMVLTGPIGWIILALVLLTAGFVHLWKTNEDFRDTVLNIWGQVKAGFAAVLDWFQNDGIPLFQKIWDGLWAAMRWTWDNIGRPIWDVLVKVGAWAMNIIVNDILPIIGYGFKILWGVIQLVFMWWAGAFRGLVHTAKVAWAGPIGDILKSVGAFFVDFWKNGIVPTFEGIGAVIAWFFDDVVKPVFRNVSKAIDTMVEAFRSGEGLIRSIWGGIVEGLAGPLEFSFRFINDKMIDPLNGLLAEIGLSWKIPKLDIGAIPRYIPPSAPAPARGSSGGGRTGVGRAATGTAAVAGVLPGYSPGIDNIRFTSPFGDLLLGGGEGIIRPEVVRAMTPQMVDALNAAAMSGGVEGVQRILGSYATGTSEIDFSKLPKIPRTDIRIPPQEGANGTSLWKRFTDLASAIKNPKRAFKLVVDKLAPYMPGQDTFIGKWLVGAMKKLADLVGGKAATSVGEGAGAVGNSSVNYGTPFGWNPLALPGTWPVTWAMIRNAAPEAIMTSNYRPGAVTASGIPSLHGLGRAVDIVSPDMAATFLKIRNLRKWSQLYYSPMGNLQIGYRDANVHRDHFSHIHAAYATGTSGFDVADFLGLTAGSDRGGLNLYDTGGILGHGDLGLNLSGKPEAVLTHEQWAAVEAAGEALRAGIVGSDEPRVLAQISNHNGATAEEVVEELDWKVRQAQRAHSRGRGR